MTHDRVMRFQPEFDSLDQAARYATDQAIAWIGPLTWGHARQLSTVTSE